MSAVTVQVLNDLQAKVVQPGLTDTQAQFRLHAYVENRSVAPSLIVLIHDLLTWWRPGWTREDRRRWHEILDETVHRVTGDDSWPR